MAGIDPDLNRQLMATLRRCDAFASNADLRAVFVDGRLSPWAYNIPEGESPAGRVQATTAFLHDKANAQGQSALVLLLYVLQDRYDPNDAYYGELEALIAKLGNAPSSPLPTEQPSTGSRIDYEAGLRLLLSRLGTSHPRYGEALVYQQRLTENMRASQLFSETDNRRAERAEIIAALNTLALSTVGVSFNELSGISGATATHTPSKPAINKDKQATVLYDQNYKIRLFGLLTRHFSLDELNTLCFTIGINFDELSGSGLIGKARELIGYCERHSRLPALIDAAKTLRPELDWS